MRRILNHRSIPLAAVCLWILGGCDGPSLVDELRGPDHLPYHALRDSHRSIALNSPGMDRLVQSQASGGQLDTPWYVDRRDRYPVASAGIQGPTLEEIYVFTYDRQSHHDGRVRDHFHSTTYRTKTMRTER